VQRFADDDGGYLDWLAASPRGVVIDAARNPAPAYLILHRARCGTIGGQPARGSRWTVDYVKFCGERAELEAFARDALAGDLRPCGLCLRGFAPGREPPAARASSPARRGSSRIPAVSPATPPDHHLPCRDPLWQGPLSPWQGRRRCLLCRAARPQELAVAPRLASWNRADDPDQVRLEAFLAAAEQLLRPQCEQLTGPLALRLDIGLPPVIQLLHQRDLDNYLYPLAARLSRTTGRRLVSVWCTKQHSPTSFVRIEPATSIQAAPPSGRRYTVRTDISSQSAAFKQQIHDQLTGAATLQDGPVSMQLGFTVGTGRNWLNLWRPAIDALGRILGSANPGRSWHPQDGRIVELGLHCSVNHAFANDVLITIEANTQRQT
jgi:hypothetical protein